MLAIHALHQFLRQRYGIRPIAPDRLDTAGPHGLKPDDHYAVRRSAADHSPRQLQPGRPRRTCIVDIVYWNVGHPELVERPLAAAGVSVAVACDASLDVVVRDARVQQGLDACLEAELQVCSLITGFAELGHADTYHVCIFSRLRRSQHSVVLVLLSSVGSDLLML